MGNGRSDDVELSSYGATTTQLICTTPLQERDFMLCCMQCLIRWSSLRFFHVQSGDPSLVSHIHRLKTKQPFQRRHSASSAYQVPSQSRRRRLGTTTSWWLGLLDSRGSTPQGKTVDHVVNRWVGSQRRHL
ncbi:hypothetical protein CGRA01v4_07257 [Colletotrichum graminicola]|nr:hypothetical protein CGRA01v4_07257 [Colletotrichum graminicola]